MIIKPEKAKFESYAKYTIIEPDFVGWYAVCLKHGVRSAYFDKVSYPSVKYAKNLNISQSGNIVFDAKRDGLNIQHPIAHFLMTHDKLYGCRGLIITPSLALEDPKAEEYELWPMEIYGKKYENWCPQIITAEEKIAQKQGI